MLNRLQYSVNVVLCALGNQKIHLIHITVKFPLLGQSGTELAIISEVCLYRQLHCINFQFSQSENCTLEVLIYTHIK